MAGSDSARPESHGVAQSSAAELPHVGRVRGILALGGVPWDQLDDGVQQVQLKLLEARRREPIRNEDAWTAVVASRVAADWHRSRTRDGVAALRTQLGPAADERKVI
ncbi:hypothetical protein [Streptomyces boninensis]|uniref:hypothetical protein n=1 Tax=Streptomyces boninensis TaxID=2039455 RepID=UPI003B211909